MSQPAAQQPAVADALVAREEQVALASVDTLAVWCPGMSRGDLLRKVREPLAREVLPVCRVELVFSTGWQHGDKLACARDLGSASGPPGAYVDAPIVKFG